MAINDDDKKFIKNTINDALSNFEAKTESKRKLFDLKRQEEDKKAREEYLKELKERDAKGEATIAQKFEMLKLSVDNAIPEDLKDAWSGSKQAIGKGANQLGKGLSTINKKIMMSNPLTAMLYNNRDLFGAGFNIAAGGLKMGWGALKGLGTGAAGLLNAAINSKKKNEETEEQDEEEKPKFIPLLGGKSAATNVLNEKQEWQEQIQDIHKVTVKQNNEQKKSNETMSKGLSGLGKTMESVKGFVDLIQQKQKLIVAGVLLGAVAILGLAAWFKGGGMSKLLNNLFNPQKDVQPGSELDQSINQLDSFKGVHSLTQNNNTEITNVLKQNNGQITNITQTKRENLNDLFRTGKLDRTLQGDMPFIKTYWNASKQGYDIDYTEVESTQPINFKLPFPVTIKEIKYGESKDKQQAIVTIERKRKLINPRISITKVMQILFPKNQEIPANTPFMIVDANFAILGDKKTFFNTENGNIDYKNYWSSNDTKYIENFDKNRDLDIQGKNLKQISKDQKWMEYYKNLDTVNAVTSNVINATEDLITGNKDKKQTNNTQMPVSVTTSPVSNNSQKAQEQTQTLKEQELNKQAEKALIEPQPQEETTPQFTQVFSDNDDYNYSYSDIGLSQRQYDAMTNNSINLSGVN